MFDSDSHNEYLAGSSLDVNNHKIILIIFLTLVNSNANNILSTHICRFTLKTNHTCIYNVYIGYYSQTCGVKLTNNN